MTAVVFAFDRSRSSHRPWQNHELAEFYRAIDILGRAGIVVVADMGVSDEGDPWFAFCRGDTGDVVVHIARIDGLLVATGIASKEIIRGAELRNIIEAVTRVGPLGLPLAGPNQRLFLHPAVILTAFIAAALAFSKQADAQELHSSPALKGEHSHGPFTRMSATLKAAGEVFGVIPTITADGSKALSDPAGPEACISLAALISAAMAVMGPAAHMVDDDPQSALVPSARPDEHSPLHMLPSSLLDASDPGNAFAPRYDASPAVWTAVHNWHGVGAEATLGSAMLTGPMAGADFSTQSTTVLPSQPTLAHFLAFADNIFDHIGAPPPHIGTDAATASAASTAAQTSSVVPETSDPTHGVDLSAISSVALAILLGSPPTGLAIVGSSDATSAVAMPVGPSPTADPSHVGITAPLADVVSPSSAVSTSTSMTSLPTMPETIVMASDPNEALGQLVDYGLTSHPIYGAITVSSPLAATLPTFTAEVSGPVQLIVFDSTAIALPVFELTKGVVFVSDHELGLYPTEASPENVVAVDLASGGVMTLLGVVSTAHLTF